MLLHAQEKEFRQIKKEKYTLYYIPYVDAPNYEEKFYRNVGFLLAATIRRDRDDDLIFHFNYTWEYPLMHFLKEYLKMCAPFWSKITFTGFLDQEDLYEIYQMADVGIMLSLHEQCSYVAIEMMMFGLPVISTDTTGLDEMFPGNLLKVQVSYQEGKALLPVQECKNKIIQALKCPQTIGSDNKQRYLERYTLNRLTEALVGLYGED